VIRHEDASVPAVLGDPVLLQEAFFNVLINAEQAIEDGGRGGRIEISIRVSRDGDKVIATVLDSGPGIPADVLPRIFDPFFTTKEVGKGTGLGLAITYGILHEHGGSIRAENAPEGGAIFIVELPALPRLDSNGD
jgi:signal transduction histidine kinase